MRLEPSWGDWFPNAFSTKNPTLLWQVASRGSPYGFFYSNLSQNAFIPSGTGREPDRELGALLGREGDDAAQQVEGDARPEQKQHHDRHPAAEDLGCRTCRSCRVMIGARWSTYSTRYFHCFPTTKNFYADPIFTTIPDNILLFTRDLPGRQGRPLERAS